MTIDATPPPGAAADWTIPQDWQDYTAAEHGMWNALFERQTTLLQHRAAPEFLEGLDVLRLSRPGIPDFAELNERLLRVSGWKVVAVPGLVPDEVFFEHLAKRQFVAGCFIRTPEQIGYLQEPDVFHDVFGHVPLLAHPVFADYMQAYGRAGQRAAPLGMIDALARLYWYTVEFGLVRDGAALKIYGAGIVSSSGESLYALEDPSANRLAFDVERVMRTLYRIDAYQQSYFVIDSFDDLLARTRDTDFGPIYDRLRSGPTLPASAVLPCDGVLTRGTQAHARAHDGGASRSAEETPCG